MPDFFFDGLEVLAGVVGFFAITGIQDAIKNQINSQEKKSMYRDVTGLIQI